MRRLGTIAGLSAAALAAGLAWTGWRFGYASPATYSPAADVRLPAPLRSWDEHDAIYGNAPSPSIVEIETDDGALLFLGVAHTKDPDDPQVRAIRSRWEAFDPTVALLESRLGFYVGGFDAGVRMFGEPGGVYALARDRDVRVRSLEPTHADEVAALLADHDPRRVAMFLTLRVFWGEGGHTRDGAESKDRLLNRLMAKRTDVEGLRGVFESVETFDTFWREEFPNRPSWRDAASEHPDGSPMRAVELASREVRTTHMARTAIDLTRKGERVFAVAGKSHVIRMEPALRAALGGGPG